MGNDEEKTRLLQEAEESKAAMIETMDKEKEPQEQALKEKLAGRQKNKLNKIRRDHNTALNQMKLSEGKSVAPVATVEQGGSDTQPQKQEKNGAPTLSDQTAQPEATGTSNDVSPGGDSIGEAGQTILEEAKEKDKEDMEIKMAELKQRMEAKKKAALAQMEADFAAKLEAEVKPEDVEERERLREQLKKDQERLQNNFDNERGRQE